MSSAAHDPEDFRALLRPLRNWRRWGPDDQRGAVNLIDAGKVRHGAGLVRLGITVSMARALPKEPATNNPRPVEHYMRRRDRGVDGWGTATDYIAVTCHGAAVTHLDALCHMWNRDGMWNGKSPDNEIGYTGAQWGGVEQWSDGIVTRGVLLDVAGARSEKYVQTGRPVTGSELSEVASASGCAFEPGDALVIHSGREAWEAANGRPWASPNVDGGDDRPGLDPSCLEFFHSVDCSVIIWDMMDAKPNGYGVPYSTHAALFNQGVALVDNALLGPIAGECRRHARTDFLVVVAPLILAGGTGSPVNPIAIL
jgi:kynurenine formamidase